MQIISLLSPSAIFHIISLSLGLCLAYIFILDQPLKKGLMQGWLVLSTVLFSFFFTQIFPITALAYAYVLIDIILLLAMIKRSPKTLAKKMPALTSNNKDFVQLTLFLLNQFGYHRINQIQQTNAFNHNTVDNYYVAWREATVTEIRIHLQKKPITSQDVQTLATQFRDSITPCQHRMVFMVGKAPDAMADWVLDAGIEFKWFDTSKLDQLINTLNPPAPSFVDRFMNQLADKLAERAHQYKNAQYASKNHNNPFTDLQPAQENANPINQTKTPLEPKPLVVPLVTTPEIQPIVPAAQQPDSSTVAPRPRNRKDTPAAITPAAQNSQNDEANQALDKQLPAAAIYDIDLSLSGSESNSIVDAKPALLATADSDELPLPAPAPDSATDGDEAALDDDIASESDSATDDGDELVLDEEDEDDLIDPTEVNIDDEVDSDLPDSTPSENIEKVDMEFPTMEADDDLLGVP